MTNQEFANVLLHHWWNLWPLPAGERIERIKEIELDMLFQEQLAAVFIEMANPEFA